ncbi:RNA polymerase sigma-70 factor [Flavitalea sp.]|nr:RNA polymerase sigma-70 factor [Flavitalea sp.]
MGSDLVTILDNVPYTAAVTIDEAGFEDLFRQNFAPLCAYCEIKFGLPAEVARDTVQSAFLKFWESRGNLSSSNAAKSYLYKTVANSSLDIIKHQKVKTRKEKHLLAVGEPGIINDSYENLDFKELNIAIDAAMSELPEQMRTIFTLCKVEGMKYAVVAEALNISVKTVETQMSRALARMRNKLSKYRVLYIAFIAILLQLKK